MPEKEHIEGLIKLLEKLKDPDWAKKHQEMADNVIAKWSESWTKKATNKENPSQQTEARRDAQLEAQTDNYKGTNPKTLKESNKNLKATVGTVEAAGRSVPDYLKTYVATPQTASGARLIEKVTLASDELRNNPNFLLREVAKAYWGTNWMEMTFQQASETRLIINTVFEKAQDLAAHTSGYNHLLIDSGELWRSFDARPDIYRTEKFDVEDLLGKKKLTPAEKQRVVLHEKLKKKQQRLDKLYELDKTEVRGELKKIADDLLDGVEKGIYNEQDTDNCLEKIKQIRAELPTKTESREVNRESEEEIIGETDALRERARKIFEKAQQKAKLNEEQKDLLRAKAKSQAVKDEVEKILGDSDRLSRELVEKRLQELHELHWKNPMVDDARERLKTEGGKFTYKQVLEEADIDNEVLWELEQIVRGRTINAGEWAPTQYWLKEPQREDLETLLTLEFRKGLIGNEHAYDKLNLRNLERVFYKKLRVADRNLSAPFQQVFDFFDEGDLKGFYTLLEDRLYELHNANKALLSETDIQKILEYFAKKRDIHEATHNFIYLAERGGPDAREQIARYGTSLRAGDAAFMFKHIRGVGEALRLQESTLETIAANHDRRLPPEILDRNADGDCEWTDRSRELFHQEVQSGEFENLKIQDMDTGELVPMEGWEERLALQTAYGFSIIDMRLPELITRVVGARDYRSAWAETLKLDPLRGLFLKFEAYKPGMAMFYFVMTGDGETAKRAWHERWTIDQFIDQIEVAESDPRYSERVASFRNFLGATSHIGLSLWGTTSMTEGWSRGLKEHQGFAITINEAMTRIKNDKEAEIKSKFTHLKGGRLREAVVKEMNRKEVKDEINSKARAEVRAGLIAGLYANPTAVARRSADDFEFHTIGEKKLGNLLKDEKKRKNNNTDWLNPEERALRERHWEIHEKALRKDKVLELIRGPSGERLVIHSSDFPNGELEITNPTELWMANPANRAGTIDPKQHLSGPEQKRVDEAQERVYAAFRRIEGDLDLVQQKRFSRIQQEIKNKTINNDSTPIPADQEGLIDSDFEVIAKNDPKVSDAERQQRIDWAKADYEEIKKVMVDEGYIDRLTDRIMSGKERYLISTVDVPWEEFNWARSGPRALERRWLDAEATVKGGKGLVPYFKSMTADPKMEHLVEVMNKEIYSNIEMYWDVAAQEFCGWLADMTLMFYGEKDWASYTGLFGDIANLSFVTNWQSRRGNYRALSSFAKVMIDHDANSWGPNERYRFIRMLNGNNLLAKDLLPWGWGAGQTFTAEALENKTGSRPNNMISEIASYIPPVAIIIMIAEGIREGLEEQKKNG